MSAPSASAAGSSKPILLSQLKASMSDERPSQKALDEFPRYLVKCWINDATAPAAASAPFNPFHHSQQTFDPTYYTEMWHLLKRFNEKKCRFSLNPSDPSQSKVIDYIKKYNGVNSQLTRPPDLALEEPKPQDLSAMDLYLVCFTLGMREAYCTGNCSLELKYQMDLKPPKPLNQKSDQNVPIPSPIHLSIDFKQFCDQMKPLPDSISCDPSLFLKPFVDGCLKPDSKDSLEIRTFKERAFARLCSLLIFVFKEAKHASLHTSSSNEKINVQQNALLVPLCFLPLVSIVCHKILPWDVDGSNQKILSHTAQLDTRKFRPAHSLVGYVPVIPSLSQGQPSKDSEETESDVESLWKKFLPQVTDDNCFPSQFLHFTKISLSDGRSVKLNESSEGRYVSLLSHYVHLLLDAVRADYATKHQMYSIHLDNLVCTVWSATMFPWIISQNPAVPSYKDTDVHANVPFRRDFDRLRCTDKLYLYDEHKLYDDTDSLFGSQVDNFDDEERFALPLISEFGEFFMNLMADLSLFFQAQASKPTCPSNCSKFGIVLLVLFFLLPWAQNNFIFYFLSVVLVVLSALLSVIVYFMWRMRSVPRANSFSQLTRESTQAFFLHRWATEYSQWTMKSEHNLMTSQAGFFEFLSSRLSGDAQIFKDALRKPGYVQWIDTLECIFHDSTASLSWVCNADSTFLKRSFTEIFEHSIRTINPAFSPTIICIVPDQISHSMFCRRRRGRKPSRIQELSSFFRHHFRVGVIAESYVKRKQSLFEQVTDLKPILKLFNFQTATYHPNGPDFDQTVDNLKRIFGQTWDISTLKTIGIIPAVSVRKVRIELESSSLKPQKYSLTSANPSHRDFLNDLLNFKNIKPPLSGNSKLVIGLKNSIGRVIMACVDFDHIDLLPDSSIKCSQCQVWDDQNTQKPVDTPADYSVFIYAIQSTELLLQDIHLSRSFEFAKYLSSASRPPVATPPKERFQTIVKQGHSFSDKLSFKVSSQHSMHTWEVFADLRNRRSLEPIVVDRFGKDLQLPSLHSPWVSRPLFPCPTLGSPFFLLFLMSKPGFKPGRPGEYIVDLRREELDGYSKALQHLSSALSTIRSVTISKLEESGYSNTKNKSWLLFKWYQVLSIMPWIKLERTPPREVLFRMRVCASSIMDVSWWLSFKETAASSKLLPTAATPVPVPSISRISTRSINAEVANLNEEILYLLRLQSLVEIASLHLKICCGALEQCVKVHNDEHLGHVQLWELLNLHCGKDDMKGDRSRIKHICRLYLEKVSNLLLLAGGAALSSSQFQAISAHAPRIKYLAFRDQMLHRFKDSWNVNVHGDWEDSMHSSPRCFSGSFPRDLSADWTLESAKLLQDVLARLCDHSIALFPESKAKKSFDPIKQAGLLPLINLAKSDDDKNKKRRDLGFGPILGTFQLFLDTWYTDSASAAKRTTTCLNFLDCPTALGSEFAAEFPGIKTPFDFLKHFQGLLRGVYECLNSDFLHMSKGQFEDLQKAILFMGERDADGGESNSDGILQILKRDWNDTTNDVKEVEKGGLATDLEILSRLADQRLKMCRSKILTLNGKAKRALLTKEDPSYRRDHHAPQDAIRLLLWHVLDWYSQRFNDHWGFPTTCVDPVNPNGPRLISNARDSDGTYLGIGEIAEVFARDHPNCIHILTTTYACILCTYWLLAWELQYSWVVSSFVAVVFASCLLHLRGKANLPYLLTVLRIIDPDDVHHGMDLAAWTNFVFFSILAATACWYLGIVSVDANTAAMAVVLPLLVIVGLIHV